MAQLFANNISTTLSNPCAATDTTIYVLSATGLPTPGSPDWFYLTLATPTTPETAWEIVKVTAVNGNALTVVRGQDNTTAIQWAAGTRVELRPVAQAMRDMLGAALSLILAAPPAIGGTTPNSGAFSSMTLGGPLTQTISTTSLAAALVQTVTVTTPLSLQSGYQLTYNFNPTSNLSATAIGIYSVATEQGSGNFTSFIGSAFLAIAKGSATKSMVCGSEIVANASTGGSINYLFGAYCSCGNQGNGSIGYMQAVRATLNLSGASGTTSNTTAAAGLYVIRPNVGASTGNTCTNLYGLYIEDLTSLGSGITVSNTYAIYSAGSAPSYLGGSLTVANLAAGSVTATSGGLLQGSDVRLKTDIHPLQGSLDRVLRMRGVTYRWNKDSGFDGEREQVGVIAQEMLEVQPLVVSQMGVRNYLAVDYGKMVPDLIEAIKEQQNIIKSLTKRIIDLESR